jgi:putative CocE/NonD family hydrolase
MQTRDGVTLRSDVYRPDAEGTFPVLVVRIPYDIAAQTYANGEPTLHMAQTRFFPQRGYIVVAQDTRGRYSSGGDFYPYVWDGVDGYDTVEWAAGLPGSNGDVAMIGKSYMGLVQYYAASERPPHLRAASPMSAPISMFQNCVWRQGVFELGWQLSYISGLAKDDTVRRGGHDEEKAVADLERYMQDPAVRFGRLKAEEFEHLPLRDWIGRLREFAPYVEDFLTRPADGSFWQGFDARRTVSNVDVPMLHVGSWYDPFLMDSVEMYRLLRENAATEHARASQRLVIGPWTHVYGITTAGQLDFGAEAIMSMSELELRWVDHWLKGIDTGMMDEPPVQLFVMGRNRWRREWEWPIARTQWTPIYLRGDGNANSSRGDGTLSFEAPGEEEPDRFVYDPNRPVPTCGGATLLDLGGAAGPFDQREVEQREDVLVYTSEILSSPVEVTGPVTMKLFAASSAPDTDFTAKLVDVYPDGSAYNVADGVVRARFRDSLSDPAPIEPGAIVEYSIDMWATSHEFLPGHRIRIDITSSDFPRYDRNPNTGHEWGADDRLEVARQTVFHDSRYPSHMILPLIPS